MKAMVNNIEIHHISPYFSLVYLCLMFSTVHKGSPVHKGSQMCGIQRRVVPQRVFQQPYLVFCKTLTNVKRTLRPHKVV